MLSKLRFRAFAIAGTLIASAFLLLPCWASEESEQPESEVVTDPAVTPPEIVLKSQKPPVFPPAAKAARFTGIVKVELQILTDGKVGEVKVLECTHPNVGFEEATVEAVKQWEFHPAMKDGEPVEFLIQRRTDVPLVGVLVKGEQHVRFIPGTQDFP